MTPVSPSCNCAQPLAERPVGVRVQRSAGDEDEPRAFGLDDAPAHVAQAGVDADDANRGEAHGDSI